MYDLHIANKNYSSWSLRPWVLMRTLGIAFNEKLFEFGASDVDFTTFSPTGKVPCLVDGDVTVWDTLAITEYLAERHPGVWAADPTARAWSRSVSAEMHSGFQALRNQYPMSVGLRIRPGKSDAALAKDLARIDAIWQQGLQTFGGPFLTGESFTAADAFFCPVAFRFQTYRPALSSASQQYFETLLELPAMQDWQTSALAEAWRDEEHENEAKASGEVIEDLRGR
jgi:glutathione S-transferase